MPADPETNDQQKSPDPSAGKGQEPETKDADDRLKIDGEVLSEADYDALAEITAEDIQQALEDFDKSVPNSFKGMLDGDA